MKKLFFLLLVPSFCFSQTKKLTSQAPGQDMSSSLKTAIEANSTVIELEKAGSSDFKFSGTIDFKGKTVKIGSGTVISGNVTIENAVISAAPETIFSSDVKLSNVKSYDGIFHAEWFGANGSDNSPDNEAIQKGLDYVIHNNVGLKIFEFRPGTYLLNKGVVAWKDADKDGNPEFFNIEIRGSIGAYMGTSNEVVLQSLVPDNFALAIQKGKGVVVRNIYFKGVNQLNYSNEAALNPASTYTRTASIRTNKFSPYAGLVIDFAGPSVTGSDRYPGFEKYYAGVQGNGGSTDCKFYNVVFDGFYVGVILTPNTNTQNNEAHVFDGIWMSNVRDAFVTTNSQERTVQCKNFKFWNSVRTCFRTNGYGREKGAVPQIESGNVSGAFQLFDFWGVGGYFPVISINNFYAENFYWIGNVMGFAVQFNNCHFTLADISTTVPGLKTQDFVAIGDNMVFDNCILLTYNNGIKVPYNIYGRTKFKNCYLSNPFAYPTSNWTFDHYQIEYEDCKFYTENGFVSNGSFESNGMNYIYMTYGSQTEMATFNKEYTSYKSATGGLNTANYFAQYRKVKSPLVRQIPISGNAEVTVTGNKATIPASAFVQYMVPNSVIYAQNLTLFNGFVNASGFAVMRYVGVENGKFVFDRVISGMKNGNYSLFALSVNKISPVGFCDIDGLNITNVVREGSTAAFDMGGGYHLMSNMMQTVSSSSPGSAKLQYSNMIGSGKGMILCQYDYEEYGFSFQNPLQNEFVANGVAFTRGAVYKNLKGVGGAAEELGWICTKSGVKGSKNPPEFKTFQ